MENDEVTSPHDDVADVVSLGNGEMLTVEFSVKKSGDDKPKAETKKEGSYVDENKAKSWLEENGNRF